MADDFGSPLESISQKRSWVDCQSEVDPKQVQDVTHGLDVPIQFSKRSRSEQDFENQQRQCEASGSSEPEPEAEFMVTLTESDKLNGDVHKLKTSTEECSHSPGGSLQLTDSNTKGDDHVQFTIGSNHHRRGCQSVTHSVSEFSSQDYRRRGSSKSNEDSEESDDSQLSDNSLDGSGWRPMKGPITWVQQQMANNVNPYVILSELLPDQNIPPGMDHLMLWKLIINVVSEPPRRKKLKDINTIDHVIDLIKNCKKIMVLTGAGVSVSCGIPDFRSRDGIYARLSVEYPDLPDPQAMFDIRYFRHNQKPFFKFAKEIYPGQFEPSKSHKFIQLLEAHGKLLRNYTQNIDTLEQVAGIKNVIQCHGSFASATCMVCDYKTDSDEIRDDIMNQVIPRCPKCSPDNTLAILKPDIVFFGESLPSEFHDQMELDKDVCDLLIVIGSSLKVRPVALIPNSLPKTVPQILINREPLQHLTFDVEFLGDCDVILEELCHRLGPSWQHICTTEKCSSQILRDEMTTPAFGSPKTPPHLPTPPNSEENTRMSFQVCSDDNSQMSTSHDMEENTDRLAINCVNNGGQYSDSCMSFEDSGNRQRGEIPTATSTPHLELPSVVRDVHSKASDNNVNSETKTSDSGTNEPGSNWSIQLDNSQSLSVSQEELEKLRACWKPRVINLAGALKEKEFLFLPPNRYVFKGAEVYDDDDDDASSLSSESQSDDLEDSEQFSAGDNRENKDSFNLQQKAILKTDNTELLTSDNPDVHLAAHPVT